jgi:hypothetical protein
MCHMGIERNSLITGEMVDQEEVLKEVNDECNMWIQYKYNSNLNHLLPLVVRPAVDYLAKLVQTCVISCSISNASINLNNPSALSSLIPS